MPRVETICACCGKAFYPAVKHAYKIKFRGHTYAMCSYTCYREIEKKIEREKHYRRV